MLMNWQLLQENTCFEQQPCCDFNAMECNTFLVQLTAVCLLLFSFLLFFANRMLNKLFMFVFSPLTPISLSCAHQRGNAGNVSRWLFCGFNHLQTIRVTWHNPAVCINDLVNCLIIYLCLTTLVNRVSKKSILG